MYAYGYVAREMLRGVMLVLHEYLLVFLKTQNGANLKQRDYDGLEPLSLLGDQLVSLKKELGTLIIV